MSQADVPSGSQSNDGTHGTDHGDEGTRAPMGPTEKSALPRPDSQTTDQQPESARRITHQNAVLRAIRTVDQLICQEHNQQKLLRGICDSLVETHGYWAVAVVMTDSAGAASSFTYSGPEKDAVSRAYAREDYPAGWREALSKHGMVTFDPKLSEYAIPGTCTPQGCALVITRIEHAERVYGLLATVMSSEMASSPEETGMLREVAGDIGPALHGIQLEKARQQAQAELEKSEQRFRTLVSSIPGAVFRTANDKHYTLQYISDGIEAITGHTAAELMRVRNYSSIMHPEDQELVRHTIDDAVAEGRAYAIEYRVIHRDGTVRWVYEQGQAVPTDDGRASHLGGVIVDITRLKELHEQQQQTSEQLRAQAQIIDQVAEAVVVVDLEGRITSWNRSAERLHGYTAAEAIGKPVTFLHPPEWHAIVEQSTGPRLEKGTHEIEIEAFHKTGRRFWIHRGLSLVHDANGTLIGTVGTASDITEWRRAQEVLKQEERKFRTLFESMSEGVVLHTIVYDQSGRAVNYELTDMNPAAERITGHTRENARGKTVTAVFGLSTPPFLEIFARVAETGEPAFFSSHFSPLGRSLRVSAFAPAKGQFATVFEDITQQIESQRENARLQQQLHHAQKMEAIGQLAGGMAHDFNNLLTVVLGHLELAQSQLTINHPAQASLATIERAARQATGVTRSLLTFSRKYHAQKQPLDLCQLVADAGKLLSRTLPGVIELRIDASSASPIWVNGDSTQLQQVLINLAVNARDAMPEGGTLHISASRIARCPSVLDGCVCEPQHPVAQLTIADTGMGMPPDVLSHIFEPFFTTKPRGQGTGLGLAIVHGIVKDHGGQVAARSTLGNGSTFTIHLPCTAPPPRVSESVASEPVRDTRVCSGAVLLAEDNEAIRRLIRRCLESEELRVMEAEDGAALLELYDQHRPELGVLILDIDLPRLNGLTCLRRIREKGDMIPAIVITGSAAVELEEHGLPGTRLLRKPFHIPELLTVISQMMAANGEHG